MHVVQERELYWPFDGMEAMKKILLTNPKNAMLINGIISPYVIILLLLLSPFRHNSINSRDECELRMVTLLLLHSGGLHIIVELNYQHFRTHIIFHFDICNHLCINS